MSDYTEQQIRFVDIFLEESVKTGDYKSAGKIAKDAAGYSPTVRLSQVMASVQDLVIESFRTELTQKIPKLIFRLEEVIDNPNLPGAKRLIDVCTTMLDRVGITKKEETTVTLKTAEGVVLLPAKNKE